MTFRDQMETSAVRASHDFEREGLVTFIFATRALTISKSELCASIARVSFSQFPVVVARFWSRSSGHTVLAGPNNQSDFPITVGTSHT